MPNLLIKLTKAGRLYGDKAVSQLVSRFNNMQTDTATLASKPTQKLGRSYSQSSVPSSSPSPSPSPSPSKAKSKPLPPLASFQLSGKSTWKPPNIPNVTAHPLPSTTPTSYDVPAVTIHPASPVLKNQHTLPTYPTFPSPYYASPISMPPTAFPISIAPSNFPPSHFGPGVPYPNVAYVPVIFFPVSFLILILYEFLY
jgi:hypothetical protein